MRHVVLVLALLGMFGCSGDEPDGGGVPDTGTQAEPAEAGLPIE